MKAIVRISQRRRHDAAFTLIEVIVALGLLATIAAASTQTLLTARRIERDLLRWRQAHALAIDAIEQARAGRTAEDAAPTDWWSRRVEIGSGPRPGLTSIEVEVTARTGLAPRVQLSTWVWRP